MKKSLIALCTSILLISNVSAGDYDTKTYSEPEYQAAIIDDSLDFSASRDGYQVKLKWNSYTENDFQYYKIMRSQTNKNPIYPEQNAIGVLDNVNNNSYELKDWSEKTANYRVCVITIDKARICSNVVLLDGMKKEIKTENIKKADSHEFSPKQEKQKIKIDSRLSQRADMLVKNLVKNLDSKYGTDSEKKSEQLQVIINKLEEFNTKISSDSTKALIVYIIEKIQESIKIMGANDEIEEIFNILQEEE